MMAEGKVQDERLKRQKETAKADIIE